MVQVNKNGGSIWNEDYANWKELEKFLRMGLVGSRIVVTTRSEKTASCIGSKHVHKLKGLSEEDSWSLFELTAFEGVKDQELVKIGENIVKKCYNIPLAIKVLGSLLHGQEKSKWESIENSCLSEISEGSDKILTTLKLSYHNLTPSLKSCFSYCAFFPKDFEMDKKILIELWMAQGYIVSLDGGQSLEDTAEEFFLILLRRCFLQDVKKDQWGNIKSVKMHDLMHDVAQDVQRDEICVVTSKTRVLGANIRHVNNEYGKDLFSTRIRSYFADEFVDSQIENMTALRALMLDSHEFTFPSLDKLLLLRCIFVASKYLKAIPDSITRLYNLQTLRLHCKHVRELPKDFSNLINLRCLDLRGCRFLIGMPLGLDKLTNLKVLSDFVAGNEDSYAELKVIQMFSEIKGGMHIKIGENYRNVNGLSDIGEGEGYLNNMKHLSKVKIEFEGECVNPEGVLIKLQPSPNLKRFKLEGYHGMTIPWSTASLPHYLLYGLESVEYMEKEFSSSVDTEAIAEFFPSLEALIIRMMSELKGWWKGNVKDMRLRFPCLSFLSIENCPNLIAFAPYLSTKNLPEHDLPRLSDLV